MGAEMPQSRHHAAFHKSDRMRQIPMDQKIVNNKELIL